MHHPRTLITYNRIAGKRAIVSLMLFALMIGWPMFASAADYSHASYKKPALSESSLRKALLRHYYRWEGSPYRFGGNSRYGIDCSGFVQIAFRDALGIKVPRSTELLSKTGSHVSYRRLVAGDIVLFKTSRTNLHTGIYIGNNQFIHASKSKGVVLSPLNSPYWRGVYYKSVRVTDHST